jgi:hypothetical protein
MPDPPKPPRRFTPPWTVEEATESFCIRDTNGQALAYVYCEDVTPSSNDELMLVLPQVPQRAVGLF